MDAEEFRNRDTLSETAKRTQAASRLRAQKSSSITVDTLQLSKDEEIMQNPLGIDYDLQLFLIFVVCMLLCSVSIVSVYYAFSMAMIRREKKIKEEKERKERLEEKRKNLRRFKNSFLTHIGRDVQAQGKIDFYNVAQQAQQQELEEEWKKREIGKYLRQQTFGIKYEPNRPNSSQ